LAGKMRYAIAGGNMGDSLRVDPNSGVLSVGQDGLDYELTHLYEIWLEAADGDTPSLRSVTLITVNVTDANDNAPIMERLIYNAEVLEEESPPQLIAVIKATDRDSGDNGRVIYRLQNDFDGTFNIMESGEIYTTMRLDREEIGDYAFVVEAVDQGVPHLTGTASVLLHLLDKNDNPPKFTRLYSLNVTENAEIGSFVIRVTSSDLDLGANANASYHIDSETGEITTALSLDREENAVYYLTLMAQDSSVTEPRASSVNLTISVSDVNDNVPKFDSTTYNVTVPDRISTGEFVFGARALDSDEGKNAAIHYSISGRDQQYFDINTKTGVVSTKLELKSKSKSSGDLTYTVVISAMDQGEQPLSSKAELTVILRPPELFPTFAYMANSHFTMSEDVKPGKLITKVSATSPKKGLAGKMRYAIAGGNMGDSLRVDPNSGVLSVGQDGLDYELTHLYEIWLEAADGDTPSLRSVTLITVNVTDANDNAPIIERLIYNAEVLEESRPLIAILEIMAELSIAYRTTSTAPLILWNRVRFTPQ